MVLTCEHGLYLTPANAANSISAGQALVTPTRLAQRQS
jgi:hypothetical protein